MKLIDTYTNLCFVSLILNDSSDKIPTLVLGITYASILPYMLLKILVTVAFIGFYLTKLKPTDEESKDALAIK